MSIIKKKFKELTLNDIASPSNLHDILTAVAVIMAIYWERLFSIYPSLILWGPTTLGTLLAFSGIAQHREKNTLQKNQITYTSLETKYNTLLSLNDILFEHQVHSIYKDLNPQGDLRVSVYIWDNESKNFLLLSRFSQNENYNKKHSNYGYKNAGWLHSIWNSITETYSSSQGNERNWIQWCQKESRRSCKVPNCSAKKRANHCDLQHAPEECPVLSTEILKNKTMQAIFIYGTVLSHDHRKIGIVLIESMKTLVSTSIQQILEPHRCSLCDLLTHIGDDLLKIKRPTSDIAEKIL